jgi:prefoldin subunit 5
MTKTSQKIDAELDDSHIVEYDVNEIGNILSNISDIDNAINKLKEQFEQIERAIKNSRMMLHQLNNEKDLP